MNASPTYMKQFTCTAFLAGLVLSGSLSEARGAAIAEPSTVFYGKVIGTGGAQPFMLYEGAMTWTLLQPDGTEVVLRTTLYELDQGSFSYRLDIPQSALIDEAGPGDGLPLPPAAATNVLVQVTVDGEPALFAGPTGSSFQTAQAIRAATYRLDLELGRVPGDADGDGLPDWWEEANGLDADNSGDAGLDLDGDGLANLDEYLRGLNPNRDDRTPLLATDRLLAFPGCITGIRLTVQDTDSNPEDLVLTLDAAPAQGRLILRNQDALPGTVDAFLKVGDTFTLKDVQQGLLVLSAPEDPEATSFDLRVRDESSEHPESSATVEIAWFKPAADLIPATDTELRRRRALALGLASGAILWDDAVAYLPVALKAPSSGLSDADYLNSYQPLYGRDLSQIMTVGRGDDRVQGGMADDLLVGGRGTDILTGHGGADLFVFDEGDLGTDTVTDFTPAEGDILDLNGVLSAARGWVHDYISFQADGAGTVVGVDLSGQGTDFSDLVVILADVDLNTEAAFDAVLGGSIQLGALRLEPRVTVALADSEASENGNNAGTFLVKREGDLASALTIRLSMSGSAQNGVDYALVDQEITLPAGQAEALVTVRPFADSQDEPLETVELVLLAGTGYRLGIQDRAELQILDLQAVVGIDVLEPLSTLSPTVPGVILITRNGKTSEGLVVRLQVGGTAANGTDYTYVGPYVTLQAGDTSLALEINQLPQAVLAGGAETVNIKVLSHASYARADVAEGRVTLVANRDRFDTWMAREFPDAQGTPGDFALSDPGQTGFNMLHRYAFGMDPQAPTSAQLPSISLEQGHCVLRVHRNPGATDIQLEVEQSIDLQIWQAAGNLFERQATEQPDVDLYRSVAPASALPQAFLRVNAKAGP